ncbi:hypothetical protein [Methanococcus maripaludis]|uniref:Uncharacterized protein n=1 Tax=Methanococcus maripaludis TaxID=39152 RepID=A0A8T4H4J7_METMI|nr:hypothetical protein [Methanococcus maripaludis]MBM7408711.1 hypothetical protein [Methanococcus maripaludis]MBP2219770.1 hypothetical protein [Methanococcus maripaludis]
MDKYDHEYRYYMHLIKNYDSFEECAKNNVEIVSKIPQILEVIVQEISIAEKMLILYHKKHCRFEIQKSHKYAMGYFNYLRENILYGIYCEKCLDMNILDLKNCYYYELNVEKAPDHRHKLFGEYIHNEVNFQLNLVTTLKNAVD